MREEESASLWNFGEPEPWRRGRTILLTILCFYGVLHALFFLVTLFGGALEFALAIAVGLNLWWLIFAFVWFGTHWLRWLLGAWTMLYGFALFIWGVRDEASIQWATGVVDLLIGASCFAPSVHFFAVRQKENIRWPEKLAVAGVFLLLLISCFSALVGVNVYRAGVQGEATRYGEEAFRRLFVENDTAFLLEEATESWKKNPQGNLGLTRVLTDKYMRLGYVENTRVTGVVLRSFYEFPTQLRYLGLVEGEGFAKCGQVLLRLYVDRAPDGWRINGIEWQCLNTRMTPGG